jgi:hypothetical protein
MTTAEKNRAVMAEGKRPPLAPSSIGWWGAALGIALGLGLLGLGASAGFREQPLPLPLVIALCVAGAIQAALSWYTIRRVRAAWAFATAIGGTAAVVFLFSAPKIRDALDVSLGMALLPAAIGAAVATLLALAAAEIK